MTPENLLDLLDDIQNTKAETQTLELKAAHTGCPKKLYGTISSFANQDEGGVIVFGIDESNDFNEIGVLDPQTLQKNFNNQCKEMEPIVRPVLTVAQKDGKSFVCAEIPGIDLTKRPCFYRGHGRTKGSYVRVGDSDETMTEYEVYSYEAFRNHTKDEMRKIERVDIPAIDQDALTKFLITLKSDRANLSRLSDIDICRLTGIVVDGVPSLATLLLFGLYPQAFVQQLCILATVVPGTEVGETNDEGARFIDNERIEGTLPEMFEQAMRFVRRNVRVSTVINPLTGLREDRSDYSFEAIREAVLNALVHRDYSRYTEGQPIQLQIFDNRIVITNPGGLYGRTRMIDLGKKGQPDTRNPTIAGVLEKLSITENRYSGIPIMRKRTQEQGLPEPLFSSDRGTFTVTFNKRNEETIKRRQKSSSNKTQAELLEFCREARTRDEIVAFVGVSNTQYAIRHYVKPLLISGKLALTDPDHPRSRKQSYIATRR